MAIGDTSDIATADTPDAIRRQLRALHGHQVMASCCICGQPPVEKLRYCFFFRITPCAQAVTVRPARQEQVLYTRTIATHAGCHYAAYRSAALPRTWYVRRSISTLAVVRENNNYAIMQNRLDLEDIICSYLLIPLVVGAAVLIGTPGGTSVAGLAGTTAQYASPQPASARTRNLAGPGKDMMTGPEGLPSRQARAMTAMPVSPPAGAAGGMQVAGPDTAQAMRPLHDNTAARWHVQLASMSSVDGARQLLARMRAHDIPAVQQAVTIDGKPRWRILVTGFRTYADAESQAQLLHEQLGISVYWIHREQIRP